MTATSASRRRDVESAPEFGPVRVDLTRRLSPVEVPSLRKDSSEIEKKTALVLVLYGVLAVLTVPVFPHFLSPNEFSRWIVAAAIVEDHSVEVSEINWRFHGLIQDLADVHGRTYSNKAPGVVLVGLPGYVVGRLLVGAASPSNVRFTLTAMRWPASTLPAILLAWIMLCAGRGVGVEEGRMRWVIAVLLFATPLFAYGMLLFSHALTAFALFAAWVLLFTDAFGRRPALAGALMGLAVLTEYPAAIVVVVFVICAAMQSRRDLFRVVLGGVPFLIVLLGYDQLAFGNPFSISYTFTEHAAYRGLARSGVFGIHLPDVRTLGSLLFDPSRGLFVLSPVLLLAFGARSARSKLGGVAFWSAVIAPVVLILVYSGYPYWHGGWGIGARYLVPALPFIVFLMAFADLSWLAAVLTGMSIAAVTMVSLVFPFVPPNAFPLPWGSLAWPILRHGLVAPDLLHLVARPVAIAVPFAVVIAVAAIATPVRWWAGLAAGAMVMLAIGMAYATVSPQWVMPRAYFEEVYFDQRGALQRGLPKGVVVSPAINAHLRDELQSPPPGWPF